MKTYPVLTVLNFFILHIASPLRLKLTERREYQLNRLKIIYWGENVY